MLAAGTAMILIDVIINTINMGCLFKLEDGEQFTLPKTSDKPLTNIT